MKYIETNYINCACLNTQIHAHLYNNMNYMVCCLIKTIKFLIFFQLAIYYDLNVLFVFIKFLFPFFHMHISTTRETYSFFVFAKTLNLFT